MLAHYGEAGVRSYSQQGEDKLFVPMLPDRGRLLDIGAWSPIALSNSRTLIENGWDAVLIEPSPGPLRDLAREYVTWNGVQVVGAAVGLERGLLEMRITDDAVSSSDANTQAIWAEAGGYYGRMLAPVITLEEISNRFGGFDFVNIDAEGTSVDLCKRMFDLGWGPAVICVEYDDRLAELLTAAGPAHYHAAHVNGTNVILRRA